MALFHDAEAWQSKIAALPLASFGAGETVLAEGTKTGRLLILKSGAVGIFKGDVEFAQVTEPGAVFGELGLAGAITCKRQRGKLALPGLRIVDRSHFRAPPCCGINRCPSRPFGKNTIHVSAYAMSCF